MKTNISKTNTPAWIDLGDEDLSRLENVSAEDLALLRDLAVIPNDDPVRAHLVGLTRAAAAPFDRGHRRAVAAE